MKPSARCLNILERLAARKSSTSFIGLGRMGHEMAHNLFSKQYANTPDAYFVVCDAVPESSRAFSENFLLQFPKAKIAIASTPEEATLASATLLTMLPSSPQVRNVYSEGIIPTLRKLSKEQAGDTLCIDSTTLDVTVAREVALAVADTGAQMVDAPVSGGVTGAAAGTLSFLVGGPRASFDISQSILANMGQRIIYCGPSGSGLGAKICNNLVLGVQQIVVAEAMLLGQKLGLDPAVLAGVINSSTGSCWASSVNNPTPSALPDKSPPCERDYEGGFSMALMLKDMGLATDIAHVSCIPLPLGETAESVYAQVIHEQPALSRKDFSSVYRYLESAAQDGKRVTLTTTREK